MEETETEGKAHTVLVEALGDEKDNIGSDATAVHVDIEGIIDTMGKGVNAGA